MSISRNSYSQELSFEILEMLDKMDELDQNGREIMLSRIEQRVNSLRHLMSHGLRQDERREAEKTLKYTQLKIEELQSTQRSKIQLLGSLAVGAIGIGAACCTGATIHYGSKHAVGILGRAGESMGSGARALTSVPEQMNSANRTRYEKLIQQAEQKINADKESGNSAGEAVRLSREANERAEREKNQITSTILAVRSS